jgi:hypothetical protein
MSAGFHPFERAGLGRAPFRCVGYSENVYSACPGHVQPGGTCCYCGQGIRYEAIICSDDGKRFTVGFDCVAKLHRDDNVLASEADRLRHVQQSERRAKASSKRHAEWAASREAKLQRERDRNGGLTDRELAKLNEEKAAEASAEAAKQFNGFAIEVLKEVPYQSDFVASVLRDLERFPIHQMGEKVQRICADIAAKMYGRRNSKAYIQAYDDFMAQCEVRQSEPTA